jgi:hypothetical protein
MATKVQVAIACSKKALNGAGPSELRSHQPVGMLSTEDVIVEVRNPLLSRNSGIQVGHGGTDVFCYAVPEEGWILIC